MKSGYNVTSRFEFLIIAGLVTVTADALNTNLLNLYCLVKVQSEERERGGIVLETTNRLYRVSCFIDWIVRMATLVITVAQLLLK